MALWQVNNFLSLSEDYEGKIDVEGLIKSGVGSIIDIRLTLPPDYIKAERMRLMESQIMYGLMPLDKNIAGPFSLIEGVCRHVLMDMHYGIRVALHENVGQGNAGFLAAMTMMKMGFTPKYSVELLQASGKTWDLSDLQKKFLNTYGEYLVQSPYVHDESEHMVLRRKMMQTMDEMEKGSTTAVSFSHEDFLFKRNLNTRDFGTTKKECQCHG